jgi:hypothetical protein
LIRCGAGRMGRVDEILEEEFEPKVLRLRVV